MLTAILLVATFIVAAIKYLPLWLPEQPGNTTVVTGAPPLSSTRAPEETAEPTPPSIPASINPQLLPLSEISATGLPAAGAHQGTNLSATVFDNKGSVVPSFVDRNLSGQSAYYNQIPGVLTFRGKTAMRRLSAWFNKMSRALKQFGQSGRQPAIIVMDIQLDGDRLDRTTASRAMGGGYPPVDEHPGGEKSKNRFG